MLRLRTIVQCAGSVLFALTVALAGTVPLPDSLRPFAEVSYAAPGDPAPMPTSRAYAAAGTAANGQIYVAGGVSGSNPILTLEAYDPVANSWRARANLPGKQKSASLVPAPNGLLYLIGGDFGSNHGEVFGYDPVADAWSPRTWIPGAMGGGGPGPGMAAAVIGDKIYVVGGYSSRRLRIYDTLTDSWIAGADMLVARQHLALVAAPNGKLYAFGGNNGQSTTHASTEEYDLATNTWTPRASMAFQRSPVAGALGSDGRIYAIGPGASVEAYDPSSDSWTTVPAPGIARSFVSVAATADGRIVVIGGETGYLTHLNAVEIFDPATNSWSPTVSPPLIRQFEIQGGLYSGTPNVTVLIQATGGVGGITQMSFSNDGANWSAWQPYATQASWTVPAATGATEVRGRVRDSAGTVSGVVTVPVAVDLRPPAVTAFSINADASTANSVQVTLSVQAQVPPSNASVSQMSFSNDGTNWSGWESYVTRKVWTLAPGEGTRTVSVKVRNNLGTVSAVAQDEIILDQTAPTGSVAVAGAAAAGERGVANPTRNVHLTATDNLTPQGEIQMRLSNRPDFAGAIWRPFAGSVTWDFTGGATVYTQFKDAAGNISQTYSQSLSGGPSGGASASPNCSPRPRVVVHTDIAVGPPEAGGAIQVTVSTTGNSNGLRAVRFDSFTNAIVHAGSQQQQTAPFAVSIPPGQEPTSLTFTLQRQTGGQSTTVRLVVVDGCGEWSTFVGGGPKAF